MKKFFKGMVALIFLICAYQSQYAQTWDCKTPTPSVDFLESVGVFGYLKSMTPRTFNIFVHVVQKSDGTGGLSDIEIGSAIAELNLAYDPANICFKEIGRDQINNSLYVPFNGSEFSNLINENPQANAIDVYFLPVGTWTGKAAGIPSTAFVIDGSRANTPIIAHEMGHCLGAYHTHSGSGCGDNANCPEFPNGSNCSPCGDRVCDTPADPCLAAVVNSSCVYSGNAAYSPDLTNIMSYAPPTCMNHFTMGQFGRIQTVIDNSAMLQATLTTDLCSNSNIKPPCQPIWNISMQPIDPKIEASNYIEATCVIPANSNHTFDAQNFVHLKDGFHAEANGTFRAYIDGCGNLRKGNPSTQIQQAIDLSIYPNPSSGKTTLILKLPEAQVVSLQVLDMNGRLAMQPKPAETYTAGEQRITLSVRDLPNGIYLCKVQVGNQHFSKKLIIQH